MSTLGLTQSEVLLKKIKDTMALLHKDNKEPVPVKSEFKLELRSDERISASQVSAAVLAKKRNE